LDKFGIKKFPSLVLYKALVEDEEIVKDNILQTRVDRSIFLNLTKNTTDKDIITELKNYYNSTIETVAGFNLPYVTSQAKSEKKLLLVNVYEESHEVIPNNLINFFY
jgi:hypothetical protein